MENFYFFNKLLKKWQSYAEYSSISFYTSNKVEKLGDEKIKDLRKANTHKKTDTNFLILQNMIVPGIPTDWLFVDINSTEIKLVTKSFIYMKREYSQSCIPLDYVENKNVLSKIKQDVTAVVDLIDNMQRDERSMDKDKDENNRKRAKSVFDQLTDEQQLAYLVNGDSKYLK